MAGFISEDFYDPALDIQISSEAFNGTFTSQMDNQNVALIHFSGNNVESIPAPVTWVRTLFVDRGYARTMLANERKPDTG